MLHHKFLNELLKHFSDEKVGAVSGHPIPIDPKTTIKALSELNKMHYQSKQLDQALNVNGQNTAPTVIININQELMPKGRLDVS